MSPTINVYQISEIKFAIDRSYYINVKQKVNLNSNNGESAPSQAKVFPVVMNNHPKPSSNGMATTITLCNTKL
uniref:Uncharacterized protein n=1 Tax=Romanomermis culicivorax TaxID=13658 RepID=A0A915HTK8_ROMCU